MIGIGNDLTQLTFQSAPPVRGAMKELDKSVARAIVSIRAPRAGGDMIFSVRKPAWAFQSAPPVRGAMVATCTCQRSVRFQSAPPVRGAMSQNATRGRWPGCFNPRPPCGGRCLIAGVAPYDWYVSIRAPRAGGDRPCSRGRTAPAGFNPRPPCGGRCPVRPAHDRRLLFQSAPPVRGAMGVQIGHVLAPNSFNPRPPCGGR